MTERLGLTSKTVQLGEHEPTHQNLGGLQMPLTSGGRSSAVARRCFAEKDLDRSVGD
jgi:hypothetical protein